MARTKKPESAPRLPKDWRDVKHGCVSCRFYLEDPKKHPCLPCDHWSHWEDAEPDQPKPFPAVSPKESACLTDTPEQTETVRDQNTDVSEPAARKTRKTAVVPEEGALPPADSAAAPTKRPGRPKKTISALEVSAAEPKNKAGRPKKMASEPYEQTVSSDTDQLSFNLK